MYSIQQFCDNQGVSLYALAKLCGKSAQQLQSVKDTWQVIEEQGSEGGFHMFNPDIAIHVTQVQVNRLPPKKKAKCAAMGES